MFGHLTILDYLVMALYLGGTLLLGLWIGRAVHSGKDFFLAGRRLPWWAIGMSLVATDIGGTDIIGAGGAAYTHGLAVGNFEWIGCVPAMIVAAFVFIPFFWRTGVYTIPEFLERRYNAGVRLALALCWLAFMACNLGIMLYASAKMVVNAVGVDTTGRMLFGWDLTGQEALLVVFATAAFVGVYTIAGGLAAVVYTDTIQCVVMIGGCLLVVALGLVEVGGVGALIDRVRERENAEAAALSTDSPVVARERRPGTKDAPKPLEERAIEHTRLILPVDTSTPFPWTGILFGLALILSPAYWIGNQAIVQRSLGARSEFDAKAAYIWGALLKNLIPVLIAVPGIIAFALYPEIKDGDGAFPRLARELLPTGVRGVFLAAFLAALMSSIDSYLNSASAILTNDLYRRFLRPSASEERLLLVGRVTTITLMVWAIYFALVVKAWDESKNSGIYAIFQTLMAFFQGPALAVLLTGILWRRATGVAALSAFIGGVVTSVGLFALNQPAVYNWLGLDPLFRIEDPFLYLSVWAFLVAMALLVVISLLTEPEPEEKIAGLIYHRARRVTA